MQVHSLTRLVEEFLESSSSGVWYVKNILKQGQLHASKEDGCPAQKISSVQTYFPKMKAAEAAMSKISKFLKNHVYWHLCKVSLRTGAWHPF